MNFQTKDLDAAYSTLVQLNGLAVSQGVSLIRSLASNIKSLKEHWKGTDATLHINNLIAVYNGLAVIVSDVTAVAHNVSIPIVNAQTIRKSNGGSGDVGEVISLYDGFVENIALLESTTEYYVDPAGAPNDFATLSDICERFNSFYTTFQAYKADLMGNWIAGSDRGKAENDFEQFETNATTYTKSLTEAKDNLGTAISNLSQI